MKHIKSNQIHKGSAMLTIVLISAVLTGMIAISMAKISSASVNGITSSKTAIQAQQYAEAESFILKNTPYNELSAKNKTKIANTSYSSEVIFSTESDYNDKIKQRTATINIYKDDETIPYFILKRPLYSTPDNSSGADFDGPELVTARSGTATKAGFLVATGSAKNSSLAVYVNDKLIGYVVGRDYGQGNISVNIPVPKNATWRISGTCSYAYWYPLK